MKDNGKGGERMKYLFFYFIGYCLMVFVVLSLYILIEFLKMLFFIDVSISEFLRWDKQRREEILFRRFNSKLAQNEIKYKFILANLGVIARREKIEPFDLLDNVIYSKNQIRQIIINNIKINRWKKIFLAIKNN